MWFGSKTVPLTVVLTSDVANYLAAAVDADITNGERIDIGWQRPVSMQEVANIAGQLTGDKIKVRAVPTGLVKILASVVGLVVPGIKDMGAMAAWFDTGKYVANTTRQTTVFGPVPTPEVAIANFARSLGHQPN